MFKHVVSGSIAVDHILVTDALFGDHLMPEHLHRVSLALTMDRFHESWGGTGANIAYALAQLGERPLLIGAIGQDQDATLRARWDTLGIDHAGVLTVAAKTAVATIFTDRGHNQITGFHPGALMHSHQVDLQAQAHWRENPEIWTILAPESPTTMLKHARTLQESGRPYLFDPGQTMSVLNRDEIQEAAEGARGILVNDYEMAMLKQQTGLDEASWGRRLGQREGALIVTQGAQGCVVWSTEGGQHVPVAIADAVVDPTGCGDAFRAGLLYGLARRQTWSEAAQMGASMAAIQIAHEGAQTYTTSEAAVLERKARSFTPQRPTARPRLA